MKKLLALTILIGCAGCGFSTSPSKRSLLIAWTGDGNPLVAVCGNARQSCKKDITVLDETTGVAETIPIAALSYEALNPNDTYAVRVNGFDWQGKSISSEYEVVKP